MGMKKILAPLLIVLLFVSPVTVEAAMVDDIAKKLVCPCNCNMAMSKCKCFTSRAMADTIEQKLAQGETKEQILDYFVAQYGEEVLASPSMWVLPLAVLVGGGAIYMALKTWVRRGDGSRPLWNRPR